jgi:hypothetical protein
MASRVQCWRTKTTWSGRPGERNAFRPHFVVDPHRLLQSNLRAARIVIGRPCRIDGIQPSNFVAWAKIHNNLYSDEPGSAASRFALASLDRACRDHVPTFSRASTRQPSGWRLATKKPMQTIVWRRWLEKPSPSAHRTSASAALLMSSILGRPRGREQSPGPRRQWIAQSSHYQRKASAPGGKAMIQVRPDTNGRIGTGWESCRARHRLGQADRRQSHRADCLAAFSYVHDRRADDRGYAGSVQGADSEASRSRHSRKRASPTAMDQIHVMCTANLLD